MPRRRWTSSRLGRIALACAGLGVLDVVALIASWSTCGGDGDCPAWHEWTNLLTLLGAPILLGAAAVTALVEFDRRSD